MVAKQEPKTKQPVFSFRTRGEMHKQKLDSQVRRIVDLRNKKLADHEASTKNYEVIAEALQIGLDLLEERESIRKKQKEE
jgi:hypothetical protein